MVRPRPPFTVVLLTCSLLAGAALFGWLQRASGMRTADMGFWFEEVAFDSALLGGPLTRDDVAVVSTVARAEVTRAFAGLRVVLSDHRDARYRVRVVQHLLDRRFRREVAVAGEARAIPGFGGVGAVNFFFLANGAIANAPPDATRPELVAAIGRGIGRAAVHELTHQLLPSARIHDSPDVESYEYAFASRRPQYFGEMRWNLAWPLLRQAFGRPSAAAPTSSGG